MQMQTVFQAGNSPYAITIPRHIAEDVGFKRGGKVMVNKFDDDSVLVKKATVSPKTQIGKISGEFKKWLEKVLIEDKGVLNELAVR